MKICVGLCMFEGKTCSRRARYLQHHKGVCGAGWSTAGDGFRGACSHGVNLHPLQRVVCRSESIQLCRGREVRKGFK